MLYNFFFVEIAVFASRIAKQLVVFIFLQIVGGGGTVQVVCLLLMGCCCALSKGWPGLFG
jgi:hypothetical protein